MPNGDGIRAADRIIDAVMILRTLSPGSMQRACDQQGFAPSGALDSSLLDDLRQIAADLRNPEDE
jgi:hypothetical protein